MPWEVAWGMTQKRAEECYEWLRQKREAEYRALKPKSTPKSTWK